MGDIIEDILQTERIYFNPKAGYQKRKEKSVIIAPLPLLVIEVSEPHQPRIPRAATQWPMKKTGPAVKLPSISTKVDGIKEDLMFQKISKEKDVQDVKESLIEKELSAIDFSRIRAGRGKNSYTLAELKEMAGRLGLTLKAMDKASIGQAILDLALKKGFAGEEELERS